MLRPSFTKLSCVRCLFEINFCVYVRDLPDTTTQKLKTLSLLFSSPRYPLPEKPRQKRAVIQVSSLLVLQ